MTPSDGIATRWPQVALRRIGKIVNGGTPRAHEEYWNGGVPFITPPDLRPVLGATVLGTERTLSDEGARVGSSVVPADSVILSTRAPIGYVARTSKDSAFNQGCRAIVPNNDQDARFVAYALMASSDFLDSIGRGTTFMEVSSQQLAEVRLPAPPVDEQRVIAGYLDRETQKIDELIAEQRGLIETLQERKMSKITDAVFGVAARTVPLRRVADVVDCAHVTADFVEDDTHFPVASIAECQGSYVDLSTAKYTTREFFDHLRAGNRAPRPGDLLFIRNASVGLVSTVPQDIPNFAVGQETVLLRRRSDMLPDFLRYALTSARVKHDIKRSMIGSTFKRVNVSAIRSLPIPEVPVNKQQKIISHLDEQIAGIDELISESEEFIALSQERRAALITAAVTGQIDVRNAS